MGAQPEDVANEDRPSPSLDTLGRTLVAVLVSWTALVAVPGALPWAATEDAARALAFAILAATVVAGIGVVVAFAAKPETASIGARIASAAATIAIFLAALVVVNLMLIPADAAFRGTAIAVGLLILLAVVLFTGARPQWTFFEGFRFSSLSLVGSVVGLALVAFYLLVLQALFGRTGPDVLDPEWIRIQDLLSGLQALAFAAAGALLGTAVQSQVTNSVRTELDGADAANEKLDQTVAGLSADAAAGRLLRVSEPAALDSAIEQALIEDATVYIDNPRRRRGYVAAGARAVTATPPDQLAAELRGELEKARGLRRRGV